MIKLLGSVLVAGGGLWLGCFAAGWLRLRLRTLEDVIRGLALLEGEMALNGGALDASRCRMPRIALREDDLLTVYCGERFLGLAKYVGGELRYARSFAAE